MSKKVTIVGAGALGSHVIQFLRSEDVALTVVDFDKVEQKNTLSQFHSRKTTGKNKADALKAAMSLFWGVKLETFPRRLEENNIAQIMAGQPDLIIDAVDNAETRKLIQGYAKDMGIACLHGAVSGDGSFGQVIWTERFVIDSGGAGGATCEEGEFLPFLATVGAYVARSAQLYLREGVKKNWQVHPGGVRIV